MHFGLFVFAISTSWSPTAQSALPDGGDDGKPERIFLPRSAAHQSPTYDGLAPHIDYYPSNAQTATAVLICPGGGYRMLSWEKEGVEPARFYASSGLDAFVLSYRLRSPHPAPYDDANSALEIIRARQPRYAHIGIIGFSAGGHLAAIISTLNAKTPNKIVPDFSFLLYPVITMAPSHTHPGSRAIALGPAASPAIEELLSAEKQVTERVPPTVLVHSMNDTTVPVENSLRYLAALRSHGVRAAAHIYDHGGHGFGCGYSDYKTKTVDAMLQTWPEFTLQFLCSVGFVVKL